jgi:hypothetical protein
VRERAFGGTFGNLSRLEKFFERFLFSEKIFTFTADSARVMMGGML